MSRVTDYKILEILELEPVSNRLRNAVYRAYQKDVMPCNTVLEYSQSKGKIIRSLYRLPGVGEKTVNELVTLLDKYSQGIPQEKDSVPTHLSIPESLRAIGITSFIRSKNCSVRLENALFKAIDRDQFRAETLGDLDGRSFNSLQFDLHRLENMGSKSVDEFLNMLKLISSDIDQYPARERSDQEEYYLQRHTSDSNSSYKDLLLKWGYGASTATEIIQRIPGRSRNEEKVLKGFKAEYADAALSEILELRSGQLHEVAKTLAKDDRLSKYLESLLLSFYHYLSSKNDLQFSFREFFSSDMSALTGRQTKILLSRFGKYKRTLDELGKEFGVTRERIRQIETKALNVYIKANRVGLFHLTEDLEERIKEARGVLSVYTIKKLYEISGRKVDLLLNIIVPDRNDSYIYRDGEYIISAEFKSYQSTLFSQIEDYLYRHTRTKFQEILGNVDGVNSQILGYFLFVNNTKFSMNADGEIDIVITSASERARFVLDAAAQPLHTSEAVRLYRSIFSEEITEHALGSTLGRLDDVLIVGPGTYALYSQLHLSTEEIQSIRDDAYSFLYEKNCYLSSRVIFEYLCRVRPDFRIKEPHFNYHLIHGVLQDDDRFQSRRGFMVGLHDFGDYASLEEEIAELVKSHGPISITELMELLRPTRGQLTNGSIRNSLLACDEIFLTAKKRRWDVADRVFRASNDVRRLQVAIRISAYRDSVPLSSVYKRVRATGIDYSLETILSAVWKDREINLEGGYVHYAGGDAEIEHYLATGEPKALWQLDYRNHIEEQVFDTSTLDALLSEFDLYV